MMRDDPPQRFLHPTDRRKRQSKLYGSVKWDRVRARVLERDGHLCQVKASRKCRRVANTVDHIIRPEEGGAPYDLDSLRASCRSCNMVRHNVAYFRERVDGSRRRPPAWSDPSTAATGRTAIDVGRKVRWLGPVAAWRDRRAAGPQSRSLARRAARIAR